MKLDEYSKLECNITLFYHDRNPRRATIVNLGEFTDTDQAMIALEEPLQKPLIKSDLAKISIRVIVHTLHFEINYISEYHLNLLDKQNYGLVSPSAIKTDFLSELAKSQLELIADKDMTYRDIYHRGLICDYSFI